MKYLILMLLWVLGCAGRDVVAPEAAAPPMPSLDFYAMCERPAIFMLYVDGQPVGSSGIFAFNVAAIGDPVSVPTTVGEHTVRYIELAQDGHALSLVNLTVTVAGPTRVDMACAP